MVDAVDSDQEVVVISDEALEAVDVVEVDDPTPTTPLFPGDPGDALPRHPSAFRHTLPGGMTEGKPAFFKLPLPDGGTVDVPTRQQLPPRPSRASQPPAKPPVESKVTVTGNPEIDDFLKAVRNGPPQPEEGDDEFAFPPSPPSEEVTEILEVPDDTLAEIKRSQRRAFLAVTGVIMLITLAITGIQMGARLSGGEKHGLGGVLADLITDQTRPRHTARHPTHVVAAVRRTPPIKQVVAQRPVQAPVPRPVSPPRAPTPQPPPVVPVVAVRPTAPPTPPPSAVVPNVPPVPTTAVPHCRLSGSFASEAEATRLGYTDVWLFPGQVRDPNTRVCLPRNAPSP